MGEAMFEVSRYEHPHIFVTSRRTGETYHFLVDDDGSVSRQEPDFDQGDPRRAAIAYLFRKAKIAEVRALLSA